MRPASKTSLRLSEVRANYTPDCFSKTSMAKYELPGPELKARSCFSEACEAGCLGEIEVLLETSLKAFRGSQSILLKEESWRRAAKA